MTPLFRRVLTAALLLAVFVPAVLWAPAWLWAILMAGLIGMAAYEWARLSRFPPLSARAYAVLLTLCALALPRLLAADWPGYQTALILLAVVFWLLVAPLWLLGRWHAAHPFVRAVAGVAVLLPTWAALLYLHARGPGVLLGVMAIVWIADTAAYFAGRHFGRHKLAPVISPGKTWEGVAGAVVGVLIYGAIVLGYSPLAGSLPLAWPLLALLLMLLTAASVIGDLFESLLKRQAGIKDSSNLLPGHGGVLDRIDALTSTLPLAALILYLVKS